MSTWIYFVHGIFWSSFSVRWFRKPAPEAAPDLEAAPAPERSARNARTVLFVHAIGFGCMYWAIGQSVFGGDPLPPMFKGSWIVGGAVILLGAALCTWAMLVFDSWRLLARVETGHRLCTSGPFRLMRNPIYAGCDLLAIGTYLWHPVPPLLFSVAFLHLGAELRARAEEKLLLETFGDEYRSYMASTKRFVPGVY